MNKRIAIYWGLTVTILAAPSLLNASRLNPEVSRFRTLNEFEGENQNLANQIDTRNGAIRYGHEHHGYLTDPSGSTGHNFAHHREQVDRELRMYYLRARYYQPGTGRFWTMDDDAYGAQKDPITFHKYLYCRANPANRSDPGGQQDTLSEVAVESNQGTLAGMGSGVSSRPTPTTCGPDVTAAVTATTLDIEQCFMPPSRGYAVAIAASPKVWTPTMAKDGWDIYQLNLLAHFGRPDFGNGSSLGTGEGRDTVQFSYLGHPAKVFYAGSVNYILWGHMFRMLSIFNHNPLSGASEFSEDMAVNTAWLHKAGILDPFSAYEKEALAFVRFGWDPTEDPSSTALPIQPNPGNVGAPTRLAWKWYGVRNKFQ